MFKKIEDLVIYRDRDFYSTFPAAANLGKGKLVVAFRRAPDHRLLAGAPKHYTVHGDILSQYFAVTSPDLGKTWSAPRLVFAPPEGGSQDAGLFYDGKYLYANSFIWKAIPDFLVKYLKEIGRDEGLYHWPLGVAVAAGSYVMRSADQGETWEGPFRLDPIPGAPEVFPGFPLLPHNRANIVRAADGSLIIPQQKLTNPPYGERYRSEVVVYRSADDGQTWQYLSSATGHNPPGVYEEPCLHITPSGKWVLLLRVHTEPGARALLWTTHSLDDGKTWSLLHKTEIHAEPCCSLRLPDGRALVGYGYRREPCGVRLRLCDPELDDLETAGEIIVRDDAEQADTGYPWFCRLEGNRYLMVYYLNKPSTDGPGHIAGTVFEID